MCEEVAKDKYGIAVFADLQGVFGAVSRKGALYKLHKRGTTNNLLSVSVFSSFLTNRFYGNLVFIIIIIIIIIIELTHSETILENTVEIEPQPVALDFKNLSQYSSRFK